MKHVFAIFLVLTLFFLSSCEEEEVQSFPCEVIGQEIQDILDSRDFNTTWITANGVFRSFEGEPSIEGCLLTINTFRYNLDQLIHYEFTGSSSILRLTF